MSATSCTSRTWTGARGCGATATRCSTAPRPRWSTNTRAEAHSSANGLYRRTTFADSIERAFSIGQATLQAVLFLMAATFLFQTPRYSRVLVLLLAPILYAFLLATRTVVGRLGEGARRQGFAFRRV